MQVDRYLFQSPYSSSVQVGRPDPNATAKDEFELDKQTNKTIQDAKVFEDSSKQEVTPNVESNRLLDIYV